MDTKICFTILAASSLLLLLASDVANAQVFDVTTLGAKADGSDISAVLADAWKQACASTSGAKIIIPKGTFTLTQAKLEGPCQSPIDFQLQGTLQAPADPTKTNFEFWVAIQYVGQLTISGGGTFDGQGAEAWKVNCAKDPTHCHSVKLPYNLGFNFVNNTLIQGVTSLNSKNFHVMVYGCNNVTFQSFTITAPGDSPNTDGIHIAKSKLVNVTDTNIQTGDDCVSVGDGTQQLGITRVTCGPGHGISVGSLGKFKNEEPVDGIYITNCTLTNTLTGIRIKSWPGANSYECLVSNVHAKDIIVQNVSNPVLIDQEYCPWNQCSLDVPSKVKISKSSFKNIKGTSFTAETVKLACSKSNPCDGIEIGDIDLAYVGTLPGPAVSTCSNIKPIASGVQNPPLCSAPASKIQ